MLEIVLMVIGILAFFAASDGIVGGEWSERYFGNCTDD